MTATIVRVATATWWNFHHHAVRGAGESSIAAATPVWCRTRSAWSSSVPDAKRPSGFPLRHLRMIASSPAGSIGRESGGSSETQALEEGGRIAAAEGMRSRRQLVGHDAEREDVGARVDRLPAQLFGRHVARRAEARAGQASVPAWVPAAA